MSKLVHPGSARRAPLEVVEVLAVQRGAVALVLRPRRDGGAGVERLPPAVRAGVVVPTPLFWAYWPDRISARAGQHSGCGDWAWRKVMPRSTRSLRTCGRWRRSSLRMSSVSTITTLGGSAATAVPRPAVVAVPGAGDPAPAVAERAAGLVPGLATGATRASATTTMRAASGRRRGRVERCGTKNSPWSRGRVDRVILSCGAARGICPARICRDNLSTSRRLRC